MIRHNVEFLFKLVSLPSSNCLPIKFYIYVDNKDEFKNKIISLVKN